MADVAALQSLVGDYFRTNVVCLFTFEREDLEELRQRADFVVRVVFTGRHPEDDSEVHVWLGLNQEGLDNIGHQVTFLASSLLESPVDWIVAFYDQTGSDCEIAELLKANRGSIGSMIIQPGSGTKH